MQRRQNLPRAAKKPLPSPKVRSNKRKFEQAPVMEEVPLEEVALAPIAEDSSSGENSSGECTIVRVIPREEFDASIEKTPLVAMVENVTVQQKPTIDAGAELAATMIDEIKKMSLLPQFMVIECGSTFTPTASWEQSLYRLDTNVCGWKAVSAAIAWRLFLTAGKTDRLDIKTLFESCALTPQKLKALSSKPLHQKCQLEDLKTLAAVFGIEIVVWEMAVYDEELLFSSTFGVDEFSIQLFLFEGHYTVPIFNNDIHLANVFAKKYGHSVEDLVVRAKLTAGDEEYARSL
jgi:hypothetical protein